MNQPLRVIVCLTALASFAAVTPSDAQPLGTYAWQLQPFCNRVVINVTQNGAVYTFDGWDDQCGGSNPRAPLVGTGTPNPDGTIGFGLTIVTTPGGAALHVNATITLPSISGTWRDSAGNSGAFVLGAAAGGPARPATANGDITAVAAGSGLTGGGAFGSVTLSTDPTVVQNRITAACPAGQLMVSVNQDGTVNCQPASGAGGDITAVNTPPGSGLLGGAASGDVTLAVDPTKVQNRIATTCPSGQLMVGVNQDGTVNCQSVTAAGAGDITAVTTAAGSGLTGGAISGDVALAVAFGGSGAATSVARADHTHAFGGAQSVAVGPSALAASTGSANTAVGDGALSTVTSNGNNTAVGTQAGRNSTGQRNTLIGAHAYESATAANSNTAVGYEAMQLSTTGNFNTAVGSSALRSNTASNITAIGAGALASNTTGGSNVAVGANALAANTTGAGNVAVGGFALSSNKVDSNTAVGALTLTQNSNGTENTAVGAEGLYSNTSGARNVAVGSRALRANTLGSANVALGVAALTTSLDATYNTAVGTAALDANTTGSFNTAIGADALGANSIGEFNVAVGFRALEKNLNGTGSTAVGFDSLANATIGTNTALGYQSLESATGTGNTAVGSNALRTMQAGDSNVAMGQNALASLLTGDSNVAIGYHTALNLSSGSNNIYLSADAGGGTESNTTRIGSAQTRAFVAGIRGVNVAGGQTVMVDANGQLGITASSRSTKQDIADLDAAVGLKLQRLRPVQFRYQQSVPDGTKPLEYGLIAEEVENVFRELVSYDAQGEPQTVRYHLLPSLLLAEVQRLEQERAAMARELAELRALVQSLAGITLSGPRQNPPR